MVQRRVVRRALARGMIGGILAVLAAAITPLSQCFALTSMPPRADSPDDLEGVQSQLRGMGFALEKDFQGADGDTQALAAPRMYYKEMQGTEVGNAFWRQRTTDKWGERAEGDAGQFDKDDLVEATYPGSEERYCAQVMRYVGNSDWIVLWYDAPEGSAQASVVKTKDMEHVKL
mmetsp:Transcript_60907/g.170320  ORF Transcript_60907/g.170320 Transcript_60907/m.170320 type:complete len:174 (-) Transcript_60907:124-645(-)